MNRNLKTAQHSDIENPLPHASSSYGSLDDSIDSNLQHSRPSSSSAHDGLSMSNATAAADSIEKNGNNQATRSPSFGSDRFHNSNESTNEQHHHRHHHHSQDCKCKWCTSHPAHKEHLIKSRQYYRDMILGVNDGLVSTFLLVAGVSGGGMNVKAVLLTAISGAIAGAISMFAGEFVATKSQNEVLEGEIKLEHEHIVKYHEEELQELTQLLAVIGIPGSQPHLCLDGTAQSTNANENNAANAASNAKTRKLRRRLTQYYASNPDALLKIMIALEFGVIDEEVRSPVVAGGTSFILFILGALPSVIPFACVDSTTMGLIVSGVACGVGLFVVGAVKTWATRGNMWLAAMENLIITAAGGGIAYGIGVGFDKLVSE